MSVHASPPIVWTYRCLPNVSWTQRFGCCLEVNQSIGHRATTPMPAIGPISSRLKVGLEEQTGSDFPSPMSAVLSRRRRNAFAFASSLWKDGGKPARETEARITCGVKGEVLARLEPPSSASRRCWELSERPLGRSIGGH